MEEALKDKNIEIKRPWQGTLWSFLSFLRLLFFSFAFLFGSLFAFDSPNTKLLDFYFIILAFIILLILQIIAIDEFLKGGSCFFVKIGLFLDILTLVFPPLGIIMLYLSISCLNHPFYNQKEK